MVVIASTVEFLANIIMPFSYNVYMFIVLRFLDGAAGLAYYQGAFIIGILFNLKMLKQKLIIASSNSQITYVKHNQIWII